MSSEKNYVAWLVERHDHPTIRPAYLALTDVLSIAWVTEADDAVHFARRADAERMCEGGEDYALKVCDHQWCGGNPRDPVIPRWDFDNEPVSIENDLIVYDDTHQGNILRQFTNKVWPCDIYRVIIAKKRNSNPGDL